MRSGLRLRVGGLTLSVHATTPTRLLEPPATHRPFLARRGADVQIELVEEDVPPLDVERPLFDSGSVWSVYGRDDGGLVYAFRSPESAPPLYKAVSIDSGWTCGRLSFAPSRGRRPAFALDYPLDELLVYHRLSREGGLGLHACGVVEGGRSLLFCGVSGAGKTTTAHLWSTRPGARVLSDDRIVLRRRGQGFWAHGTPWHGEGRFATPLAGPLAAVFFLRHGEQTRLTSLSPGTAAALLLARSFPPIWDGEAMGRVTDTCARAAQEIPCYELAFVADASAVESVLAAIG